MAAIRPGNGGQQKRQHSSPKLSPFILVVVPLHYCPRCAGVDCIHTKIAARILYAEISLLNPVSFLSCSLSLSGLLAISRSRSAPLRIRHYRSRRGFLSRRCLAPLVDTCTCACALCARCYRFSQLLYSLSFLRAACVVYVSRGTYHSLLPHPRHGSGRKKGHGKKSGCWP